MSAACARAGRGYGFSFTSNLGRRAGKDEDKGPKAAETGWITGSDNDLRRLSIEACVSILLRFGVEKKVVEEDMSRSAAGEGEAYYVKVVEVNSAQCSVKQG